MPVGEHRKMWRRTFFLLAGYFSMTMTGGAHTLWAETEPVIVVVHGVGRKIDGWTDSLDLRERWGSQRLIEINFNQTKGATESLVNFLPETRNWADHVKEGIQAVARKFPGCEIAIVSHSWGSVVSKLVLSGGSTWSGSYPPLMSADLGTCRITHLTTMGSPLCHPGALRLFGIVVNAGKPKLLEGKWLNLFNKHDRVTRFGIPAGNEPIPDDCENLELDQSIGHTGYWLSDQVAKIIREAIAE